MKQRLQELQSQALAEIGGTGTLRELEDCRVKYLGRKGPLTEVLRGLGQIAAEERPAMGQVANQVRDAISAALETRKAILDGAESERLAKAAKIDLTLPGRKPAIGHMHPVSQVEEELVDIFRELGFQVATGPEIETEHYNFDALNTPSDHPARDSHDTFYIRPGVILRTHTSPVQVRTMESTPPPVAIIAPGRTYRVDDDASHSPMFRQIEGLLVDEGISFADLKGTLLFFVHRFFGQDTKLRLRPSFFPFTEPSAEVDISCTVCKGAGCRVCKHSGWVEILGCGMVHPNVFRGVGYDEKYTGFAFGMGVERITILRHAIPSIHHLYENDQRFLEQF